MSIAVRGFLLGLAAGLLLAALGAGSTRFDAFVRVSGGGQLLLDARLDESAIGRVMNIPVGTLGDASFTKRTWMVVTTYRFVLRIRPEAMPGPGRAVQGLQVVIKVPGRVVTTNATRVAADAVVWDPVPPGELSVTTRAVHWGRILVLLGALVVGGLIVELATGLFGMSRRS